MQGVRSINSVCFVRFFCTIFRFMLEWGWNVHAETYYSRAQVGQKRKPVFRLVVNVLDVVDVAVRVERSGVTCLPKNYYLPLISCVSRLI